MRLHLVAFPHERIDLESASSFSANAASFRDMMTKRGHEVVVYDGDDIPDSDQWDRFSRMWVEYNARLVNELQHTEGVICLIAGDPYQDLLAALPERIFVEISPGYLGLLANSHRVFESYAWMHWTLGKAGELAARPRDTVINHFYDPANFGLGEDGGYLLFVGRAQPDKGVQMVLETAHRSRVPLVTIGHGSWPLGVDARGFVSTDERNKLMANATALLCPTLYVEPGGHVASEALMCGTPVISTDWGCFTEFVDNGVNGYRCHDVEEMSKAVKRVRRMDRGFIQRRAHARFSYDAIAPQFEAYFERIG